MLQQIAIIIILLLSAIYLVYYFTKSRKKDKCASCRLKELAQKRP